MRVMQMGPTEILKAEHEGITEMLRIMDVAAGRLEADEQVNPTVFADAVDFLSNFTDRCHHGKEERHLFRYLIEKGMPREGGPIAAMLAEHEEGRSHVRAMKDALDGLAAGLPDAARDMATHARAYVQLLTAHIAKENDVLFPMTDLLLRPDEQNDLVRKFEQVEAEEMGEGTHEHYHEMIHSLREKVSGSYD